MTAVPAFDGRSVHAPATVQEACGAAARDGRALASMLRLRLAAQRAPVR